MKTPTKITLVACFCAGITAAWILTSREHSLREAEIGEGTNVQIRYDDTGLFTPIGRSQRSQSSGGFRSQTIPHHHYLTTSKTEPSFHHESNSQTPETLLQTKKRQLPESIVVKSGHQLTTSSQPGKQIWRPPSQDKNLAPASFHVLDSDQGLPQGAPEFLGELAQDFKTKLEDSGLAPDSSAYKALWETEEYLNDIRFKTTYGDSLWLQHHNALLEAEALRTAE